MLSVRLSKDLETRLEMLSTKTNRTKSYYVQKALRTYLDDKAEYELAAESYKEYLASGKKIYTLAEIKESCGLS